jgi:hypothetical protein
MATRTISDSGGTRNFNDTASWVEAAVPTSADDVVATATSSTLILNVASACRSFDMTGYVSTFTLNDAIALSVGDGTTGHFKLVAGMTLTIAGGASVRFNFVSTTTGNNVTTGGKLMPSVNFNGVGGVWTFQDSFTHVGSSTSCTVTNGHLNTNGVAVQWGTFSSNFSNVRTLTFGASTITIAGSGSNVWALQTITNLTFNVNTSIIIMSGGTGSATTFQGGGLTYNEVRFTGSGISTVAGANTFATLTRTGTASTNNEWQMSANQVITGTLTINGNSINNRMMVNSNGAGTQRTLTAATVVVTNADFQDIIGAGAGSWNLSAISGGSGDCGNNSGITFTTGASQFWVGGTGSVSTAAEWASTSGGSGGTGRTPLCQDAAIFDANSFSAGGQTVTLDLPRIGDIDFTGATNSPTFTVSVAIQHQGGLVLIAAMTFTVTGFNWVFQKRGTVTVDMAGKSFGTANLSMTMPGGTFNLASAFAITNGGWTINSGTFNTNGYAWSSNSFSSSNTNTRTINLGASTVSIITTSGSWSFGTTTGLTFNAGTSTILFTASGAGTRTFTGGGLTYATVKMTGTGGTLLIVGANTFSVALDIAAPNTLLVTSGTTQTLTNFIAQGTSGDIITITSSSLGSAFTLSKTSGVIVVNFCSIRDSAATGGAIWYAGNSTNVSGNSGWRFQILTGMNLVNFSTP